MGSAAAQEIKWEPRAVGGQWTISFSRKFAPSNFEVEAFRMTKAEAVQVVDRLTAWSNSMDSNSSWRLAVILIEGKDSQPPKQTSEADAPAIRDPAEDLDRRFGDFLKDTQETLQKVLKESKQDVDRQRSE